MKSQGPSPDNASSLRSNIPTLIAVIIIIAVVVGLALAAKPGSQSSSQSGAIRVVAAENFWGSIAAQLGGDRVKVTNIINNPDTDPHSYEPTAADSRTVADARYVIINGIGYDPWMDKLLSASKTSAKTLKVGDLVGIAPGGNPHQWYSPESVRAVIAHITESYKVLRPADAAYFDQQRTAYENNGLKQYNALISEIKSKYAGVSVGASESIFTPLAKSLGLNLITPESFLTAMSEGTDPTAADKAATDQQITGKQIKVYVYNSQNSSPDVTRQVDEAKTAGIPVVTITETPVPANSSFQDWQVDQLRRLRDNLAKATGR
ncbi:MAG: transporter substrate-binding protein [Patescibacteria group bacterium]|nr:transporter substrate-binding protein [Patescibacteria group bacterium]